MYNRYVPQQDGTFQKNRISTADQPPVPPEPKVAVTQDPIRNTVPAAGFLRQLIPQNLDTGDLMIILLLLLMAGDCQDNKNSWLLTLALYLFL